MEETNRMINKCFLHSNHHQPTPTSVRMGFKVARINKDIRRERGQVAVKIAAMQTHLIVFPYICPRTKPLPLCLRLPQSVSTT